MSAVKHTPGPRAVLAEFREKITPGCDLAIVDEFLMAYMAATDAARVEAHRLELLHAAAPELLEAHREAAHAVEDAYREALRDVPDGSCIPPWIVALERAGMRSRAAITKATGSAA